MMSNQIWNMMLINRIIRRFYLCKDVPLKFAENWLINHIQESYKSVTSVDRFKKDGKQLHTIKISCSDSETAGSLISDGIVIDGDFYACEKCNNIKKPLQCYQCWRFGHTSQNCTNDQICLKCSGKHAANDCEESDRPCCTNCKHAHFSNSKKCTVFLKKLAHLNGVASQK